MQTRSPELRLLLAVIRAAVEDGPPCDDVGELTRGMSWISFMTLALQHQVGGLALAGLSRISRVAVPPPVFAQLTNLSRQILSQRAAAIKEIGCIAEALGGGGVEIIPIKGPLMRQRLFGNIAAGPSRDIDFLISSNAANAAFDILARRGYRRKSGLSRRQSEALLRLKGQELLQRDDGQFVIEPHISILPSNLCTQIDHEALWRRAHLNEIEGAPIRILEAEDEFLLLAVHGSKECWARLKWLADLAKLAAREPQIDYEVVFKRAGTQGVLRMVCLAVLLLADTFGREFAHITLRSQDRRLRTIARRIAAKWERPLEVSLPSMFEWSRTRSLLCDNVHARTGYFFRTVTTPREVHFSLAKFPDSVFPAYYATKIVHDYALWPCWMLLKRMRLVASGRKLTTHNRSTYDGWK